ncbi:MAG: LamG domain-containing protein, partial [bacterium]
QYLNTTNGNSIKNTTEFTISVWIRPTNLTGVKVIYEEPTSTLNSRQRVSLRLNGNKVNFIGRTNDSAASATNWVISPTVLAINNWYHVVAIFNSNTDIHQLYINNVVQNSTVTETAIPNTNPIVTPKISQQATGTGAKFIGNIDELAIWNRTLSNTEVENAFLRGFRLRFQVQSCTAVALCTAANFKGPGGTNATWYTELNNASLTSTSFALNTTTAPNRQYFQYQAQFQNFTTASTQSALLNSFIITYSNPPIVPSLALAIRKNDDTSDSLICDFGTVSTGTTASCSYRLKVSSSSVTGYTIFVRTSGSLTDGTTNISDALAGPTGSDISAATLGVENYGVNITKGSATGGTTTLSAAFSAGTNEVLFTPLSATSLISSNGPNSPAATDLTNTSLITHQLNISNATKAGNYSQTITYTVLATF